MRIGVLGGTFDPVHRGHLAIAAEARRRLNLARVIFVPAGHPYFKASALISPAQDRVHMLELALARRPHFCISLTEIERPGPSYAVETLAILKHEYGAEAELFFILGWDSLLSLPRWQEPQRILELCTLVGAPRPGYPRPDMAALEEELPGISCRTVVLDRPFINISATAIRARVREGQSITRFVHPSVARYIQENGLYRDSSSSSLRKSRSP